MLNVLFFCFLVVANSLVNDGDVIRDFCVCGGGLFFVSFFFSFYTTFRPKSVIQYYWHFICDVSWFYFKAFR